MLEEHHTINSLSVNGSFASLPFCTQMIADMFNKPVKINNNTNSIGLGTFLISATEMGIYDNLEVAAQSVILPDTFVPKREHHDTYMKYFKIFERLSVKLNEEFEAIANLQQDIYH